MISAKRKVLEVKRKIASSDGDCEELEELKRKHRASEQKAMVKADMDYLKGMLKHQMEKEAGIPSFGTLQGMGSVSASAFSAAGTMGSTSIDVQV